jgi:hypothetical protein
MTTDLATTPEELATLLDDLDAGPVPGQAHLSSAGWEGAQPPRPVRATMAADGVGFQLLIGDPASAPSALDVDPRLLTVRRFPAAPPAPAKRTLDAPQDPRAEERAFRRRRLIGLTGVLAGAVAAGLSFAQALA